LRGLFTSGTPGLEIRGTLPADITGQIELAWKHILSVLEQANMDLTDVVKVTQYLTRAEDIVAYAKVRTHFSVMLSQHRCSCLYRSLCGASSWSR
jgi:enamine deaminase RidA (YjgF/YER057c/UK114 family)